MKVESVTGFGRIAADVHIHISLLTSLGRRCPGAGSLEITADRKTVTGLTPVAAEGELPADLITELDSHDAWFCAKVQEVLAGQHPINAQETRY